MISIEVAYQYERWGSCCKKSYVKIYTRTRLCKSKISLEARLFTVNKSNIRRISRINVLRHSFVRQKLYSENVSYVKVV